MGTARGQTWRCGVQLVAWSLRTFLSCLVHGRTFPRCAKTPTFHVPSAAMPAISATARGKNSANNSAAVDAAGRRGHSNCAMRKVAANKLVTLTRGGGGGG